MINLEQTSGLPIELTDDFHLRFKDPLKEVSVSVRKFADMMPVWMDQGGKPSPTREDMYYMYRDVHLPEHEDEIRKNNLRYDMTILPAAMIGREFNKTVGHYHPIIPGKKIAYPEFYEVIEGEGLFMIQKVDESGKNILDIQATIARTGDKIVYPPDYGHIMVNIGKGPLITSNWEADNFKSIYEPVRDMAGMGYYVVANDQGRYDFVPNKKYLSVPGIKINKASDSPGFGLVVNEPMYITGIKDLSKFDYLNNPEKY